MQINDGASLWWVFYFFLGLFAKKEGKILHNPGWTFGNLIDILPHRVGFLNRGEMDMLREKKISGCLRFFIIM